MSRRNKAWLWFAVAWLVSPIDLIPEFIPFLGPLDDAVVAALVLRHVLRTDGPLDPRGALARRSGDPGYDHAQATPAERADGCSVRSNAVIWRSSQSRRLNQIPPGPFEKLAPSPQTATVFPVFVTSIAP